MAIGSVLRTHARAALRLSLFLVLSFAFSAGLWASAAKACHLGNMTVSPAGNLSSSGVQGGPFSPASKDYTLGSTGGQDLIYDVSADQPWIDLSSTSGIVPIGNQTTVTVSINASANALAPGNYTATITFTSCAILGGGNTTRTVNLTVQGALSVTPATNLSSSGPQAGPFAPTSQAYTLGNTGPTALDFTAAADQTWISVSTAGGSIAGSGSTNVTVSINTNANALAPGNYTGTVTFTNTTNGNGTTTRTVSLTVRSATGQVTLRVIASDGEGMFSFSSPTPALQATLTTNGGSAQSSPVSLVAGTYAATLNMPEGFALRSGCQTACNIDPRSASNFDPSRSRARQSLKPVFVEVSVEHGSAGHGCVGEC